MKVVLKFIFALIIVYVLFVAEECYRLKRDKYADPLLVVSKEVNVDLVNPDNDMEVLNSVGFKLKRSYIRDEKAENELLYKNIVSEEFVLLDDIVVWGWIE